MIEGYLSRDEGTLPSINQSNNRLIIFSMHPAVPSLLSVYVGQI